MFSSCCTQKSPECVTVDYLDETKLVLDINKERLNPLVAAIEKYNSPLIINGQKIRYYQPANGKNLNGYAIEVQKNGKIMCAFLYKNFPFCIAKGNKLIYDFKHLLTEEDIRILCSLIPEWKAPSVSCKRP